MFLEHPQAWIPHYSFKEETSPNTQTEPPLVQLKAIPARTLDEMATGPPSTAWLQPGAPSGSGEPM